MFIKDNWAWINVEIACNLLDLSKSAYYLWLNNIDKQQIKLQCSKLLEHQVINEFHRTKRRYGASRLLKNLHKQGISCNYKQVLEIMKNNNLIAIGYKAFKITTNSNHKHKIFDNLLNRNFSVNKPNVAWVGDITYIKTKEVWLYLATVIDLYSRKVVGYSMSNRMTRDLVISALLKALKIRAYPQGVIIHSDRGSQYASKDYKYVLKQYKLLGSMSKQGDCWDNAVAESFFATLKKEYIYQTSFKTRTYAKLGIFDYIEAWYNNERMHSYIDYLSPNEFEENYYNKDTKNN
jgi:transposase InsO family protein